MREQGKEGEVEVHLEVAVEIDTMVGHTTVTTGIIEEVTAIIMPMAEETAEKEEEEVQWTETEEIMMTSAAQIFYSLIEVHQEMEETAEMGDSEEVLQEKEVSEKVASVIETMRNKESSEKVFASIAKTRVTWLKIVQRITTAPEVL